jgi:hypothetical protein
MGEEKIFLINDTYRALADEMAHLQRWQQNNPLANHAAVAEVLRHLKEAQFWSLELVLPEESERHHG